MKRPLCKLCGTAHYTHEPHKFDNQTARSSVVERGPEAVAVEPQVAGSNPVALTQETVDEIFKVSERPEPDIPVLEVAGGDAERESSSGKPERLDVAKHVLTAAERYARWRAIQIEKDPFGFRKREADRIARIRAGPKSPV